MEECLDKAGERGSRIFTQNHAVNRFVITSTSNKCVISTGDLSPPHLLELFQVEFFYYTIVCENYPVTALHTQMREGLSL